MKKTTTWAVLGSLVINLVLGFVIAVVFSVAPAVQADETAQSAQRAAAHQPAPARLLERTHAGGYLVAVRMGWAAG